MTRRTTLGYYNPSDKKKAERLAKVYRKKGYKVVVEKDKRWGTINVMKINNPKRKRMNPYNIRIPNLKIHSNLGI